MSFVLNANNIVLYIVKCKQYIVIYCIIYCDLLCNLFMPGPHRPGAPPHRAGGGAARAGGPPRAARTAGRRVLPSQIYEAYRHRHRYPQCGASACSNTGTGPTLILMPPPADWQEFPACRRKNNWARGDSSCIMHIQARYIPDLPFL